MTRRTLVLSVAGLTLLAAGMAGCERQESATYDPQVDGIVAAPTPDAYGIIGADGHSIDQTIVHRRSTPPTPPAASIPTTATSAPTTAPEAPREGTTPPEPPGGETAASAPAVASDSSPPMATIDVTSGELALADGMKFPQPAGFKWQVVGESRQPDASRIGVYAAKGDSGAGSAVVTVQQPGLDTDAKKTAAIKGFYNGFVSSLKEQGYSALAGAPPATTPPYGDRVSFTLAGNDKEGKHWLFKGTLVFGKNTLLFQFASTSQEQLDSLAKLADTPG